MRVTRKGQVTIPKELRDSHGIGPGAEVLFEAVEDKLVLRKIAGGPKTATMPADRLAGHSDVGMTTDQIMVLTRGG